MAGRRETFRRLSGLRGGVAAPAVSSRRFWLLGWRFEPFLLRHNFGCARVFKILRRHDLHAIFVKNILYVGVQATQYQSPWTGFCWKCLADKPVLGIPVGQRGLKHLRRWVRKYPRGSQGSFFQHCMYLPPRRVVADSHRGVEYKALALYASRVVLDVRVKNHCVCNR